MDTVVQVGAWTDDCIISTAFHAFSLQYDVVLVADGVSTASKQHFNAIEVMRGAVAKVVFAEDVAHYLRQGRPVQKSIPKSKLAGPRALWHERQALSATSLLSYKANTEDVARSDSISVEAATRLVFAVGCTSIVSFVSGWILRGFLPSKMRGSTVQHYQHLI